MNVGPPASNLERPNRTRVFDLTAFPPVALVENA
jgi:hypothetical protein